MIKIIDSVMGSGKTTYILNYMKKNPDKKYFVVTPFLSEIERIIKEAHFLKEPLDKRVTKSQHLYQLICEGHSIVTTHAMFCKLNLKMIQLIEEAGYTLILDEVTNVFNSWEFDTKDDERNFFAHYGHKDDEGRIYWNNEKNNPNTFAYASAFYEVMHMCKNETLVQHKEGKYINLFPIKLFKSFEEVFILTYMFKGSLQKSYFDLYEMEYDFLSVKDGVLVDYEPLSLEERTKLKSLINIIDKDKMNSIGNESNALNVTWYKKNIPKRGKESEEIKNFKKHITNFFKNICKGKVNDNLFSTFKEYEEKLNGSQWNNKFIPFNSRATNEFNHIQNLAYIVNIYPDGDLSSFLYSKGCKVNIELYALSTLIQTIFRTRIRNFDKPDEERTINLYIPSSRMRNLLKKWLNNEIG
jgi:hypothetical protein